MNEATISTRVANLILIVCATTACIVADPPVSSDAESSDTAVDCTLGEESCPCNAGQCFGVLECVNDVCVSADCMPGSQGCECANGTLCLGDLECVNGICGPPGEGCTPQAYHRCADGNIYWFDSCDQQGSLKETCDVVTQNCVNLSDTEADCIPKGENCPDGEISPGEDCEGSDLGGESCESLGYGGGQLACKRSCTFDESGCSPCGNGIVDAPGEDCDGADLQGASCMSFDFIGGDLSCGDDCSYDFSGCLDCECNGGPCCANSCDYDASNVVCEDESEVEYGCPGGSEPGADVSARTQAQYCSGTSESCSGSLGPWTPWSIEDDCGWNEYCTPNDPTCNLCSFSHDVTQYECSQYSSANGNGPGGGEIMEICASTNSQTGYMTVKARKYDNSSFGPRPYQVRVSGANDDPCGPNSWFFVISDDDPVGIGTDELTFSFPAQWEPEQWDKAYCITASTTPGDPGYDGNNPQQQSWWYSDKTITTRDCQ